MSIFWMHDHYCTFALVALRYVALIFIKMADACATSPVQLLCLRHPAANRLAHSCFRVYRRERLSFCWHWKCYLTRQSFTLLMMMGSAGAPSQYCSLQRNSMVRTHKSAIAFLTNLPEIEFGCIVTDLYMPCVDGIELIGHLRARGASTPVIVLSGRGDLPIAVKAMRAGAIEFLEKPADADELVAWVRSALVYQNAAPTYGSPG